MQLIRYTKQLSLRTPMAVAIGNFDGVHRGHQKLLAQLHHKAKLLGLKSLVCVFQPLTWQVFQKDHLASLTNLRTKISLLSAQHIDYLLVVSFKPDFRSLTAAEFIQNFLTAQLNTAYLITGEDFRFGQNRSGGVAQLVRAQDSGLFQYESCACQPTLTAKISSSDIRTLLAAGKLGAAKRLLGGNYHLIARVISGQKLGKAKLGFPTANLGLGHYRPPLQGVFACRAYLPKGTSWQTGLAGIANLGKRPTFNGSNFQAEVHILNFNQDIYGSLLKLEFIEKLRAEQKFNSIAALTEQLKQDRARARTILSASGLPTNT